jgi:hypothetical protein
MTDHIDQPNRELDLLVAEKVMGLIPCDQWTENNLGSAGGPALWKHCKHDNCYSTLEISSLLGTIGGCPRYSSKIQETWEVVRRMRSSGYDLTLESGNGGQEWFAVFHPSASTATEAPVNQDPPRSSGASAETAVGLAAINAISIIGAIESA